MLEAPRVVLLRQGILAALKLGAGASLRKFPAEFGLGQHHFELLLAGIIPICRR